MLFYFYITLYIGGLSIVVDFDKGLRGFGDSKVGGFGSFWVLDTCHFAVVYLKWWCC